MPHGMFEEQYMMGTFRRSEQSHPSFIWCAIAFFVVAFDDNFAGIAVFVLRFDFEV